MTQYETVREVAPGRPGPAGRALSVLAVTSGLPWPLDSGGHLRTFHLLRALARRHRVRLVAPEWAGQGGAIGALRGAGIDVIPAAVAPRTGWREALRAMAAAARREPYVMYRRHGHRAVRVALRAEAGREPPDVLYLDHLDSWLLRPGAPGVPVVIDLHNIYSTLARRAAREHASRWARLYLGREAILLGRMERRAAGAADVLMVVSEEDRSHVATLGARAVRVVPNGVDCAAYAGLPTGRLSSAPIILFVGSLSWEPNVAAARALAADVLPRVRARIPGARVRIVGRAPVPEVGALGRLPGVEVLGSVPDVSPYLREASVLAVPLEAGGGTRLKILEAFAAGLPVVSTPVGCEGLEVAHGDHLLVAGRDHLADALARVLGDPTLGGQLAARARGLVRERYDWGTIGRAACAGVEAAAAGPRRGIGPGPCVRRVAP